MPLIIDYEDIYQHDFERLNIEWLDKYHLTESHDLEVLSNPRGTIINRGGYIYLAKQDELIAGSAALVKEHNDTFELAKMAVAPEFRGMGISKLLLEKCLQQAASLGAKKIILWSNSQLKTALGLYEKYGFVYVPVIDSPFVTADIKMELSL